MATKNGKKIQMQHENIRIQCSELAANDSQTPPSVICWIPKKSGTKANIK